MIELLTGLWLLVLFVLAITIMYLVLMAADAIIKPFKGEQTKDNQEQP